jgi:hypothetical protein
MSNRSSLELSTRTVKIYSGAADATARADLAEHVADLANPHVVTAEQLGLGSVDDTSDADKPISDATAAALALLAPLASPALSGLPTAPTAALGTVTGQLATTQFVAAALDALDVGNDDALAAHLVDYDNPHAVDAGDLGLGAVDNTADLDKPVSTATQTALNATNAAVTAVAGDLDLHLADTDNPHAVSATDVGLGNVDNTADADKPVSDATQAAINAATAGTGTVAADLAAHVANTSNPHAVDKADVGLGAADNTADLAKPVSTAQQTAINAAAAIGTGAQADIDGHQLNVSNPHSVTKAQVGLGAVDNTADAAKPISAATQTALNLKAPLASPAMTGTPTVPTAPPLTNSTQAASTAYADAAVATLLPAIDAAAAAAAAAQSDATEALADAATAQAAAVAAQADASQALTEVALAQSAADAAQTTADAAQADATEALTQIDALEGAAGVVDRPGDAVALYGTLATGTAAAMPRVDPAWVATSAAGNVVRVNSATADDPQVIAPAAAFTVGPVSDIRWQVQRQTDPADPLNDSVTLAVRWLTNTYAGVAGAAGISTVANLPLVVADGVVTRTARIGGGGLVPPAGAVYFRPYVQLFGNNHVTDVIVLGVDAACSCGLAIATLLTTTTALAAGTTGLVLVSPAAAMTVTLPPSPVLGQTLTVKDAAGNASARNITIAGGGPLIEGAATMVLGFNYGWVALAYSGSQWLQV